MDIDLLYVPDCPHRSLARDHVDLALARTRRRAVVREREIHSSEEADRLGMRGSPTILIDGQDPFADSDEPAGLSCRRYRSEAGVGGAPSVRQLVEALGG
jgi:hypothetical protein